MRWSVLVLPLLTAAAIAGCLNDNDAPVDEAPEAPAAPPAETPRDWEDDPTFCETEAGCTYFDDDYHEYVLYTVDSYVVDVLIVPPASPFATRDTETMRAAVQAWADGIQELGETWFASNFTMNVYVLGTDVPPQEAMEDPEIVVLGAEYNPVLLFGIGAEPKQLGCEVLGQETLEAYPSHDHDGWSVMASDCTGAGFVCFAVNTNFLLGGERRMYDLVAHEFGHCLGGGHVGDALDFSAKRVPVRDIMSYQNDPEQVHCVSNLNVRVLEDVYAPLLGMEHQEMVQKGDWFLMDPDDYTQVVCENPAA